MKKMIVYDLLIYMAVPYFIWNYGREPLGDYAALLLSTVPGLLYTLFRFINERQFNITGTFILASLLLDTLVNLLSGSAERMLWNQVYLGYGYAFLYLISILLKKPMGLYFGVDFAYMLGHPRELSKKLFFSRELFNWFQLVTLLLVIRGIVQNSLKAWLLNSYGVDSYGHMLVYLKISGGTFSIVITSLNLYIGRKVVQVSKAQASKNNCPPSVEDKAHQTLT
ncbi:hypothetical protein NCCP2222_37060 [Sporosarcina sp. NCCP-2222]|uniref:VC0807 family protein n=1 Tax=Sporosarcina sp. NCCP-2222 TaxID=2935073 RepID=UPI00207EF51C|nr:VC0807 family protein [Sporosarcina sp. NCCP-2222]GKV57759.1 hypothetical protein NCCP2222_37060 [Sporosarcina sp. NCCP-2222]